MVILSFPVIALIFEATVGSSDARAAHRILSSLDKTRTAWKDRALYSNGDTNIRRELD
jgi:hypothetical protein